MKKTCFMRILSVLLTVIMLLSVALPTFAATIPSPNEDDPYYTLVFENGVLTVHVNAEKVYDIIKDGNITEEEFRALFPEDILTLLQGDKPTADQLFQLARDYLTTEDVKQIMNLLPSEVFFEYFDLARLEKEGILTLEELLSVIPVDTIMENANEHYLSALFTEEVMKAVLTEKVREALLDADMLDIILADEYNKYILEDIIREELSDKNVDLKQFVEDMGINEQNITKVPYHENIGLTAENVYPYADESLRQPDMNLKQLLAITDYDTLINGLIAEGKMNLTNVIRTLNINPKRVIDAGYFTEAEFDDIILKNATRLADHVELIEAAGGYSEFAKLYSMSELTDIFEAMGLDAMVNFYIDSGIRPYINMEQIYTDLMELLKTNDPGLAKTKKAFRDCITSLIVSEIDEIYLNRTPEDENRIYLYGKFDTQEIVTTILQEIPDCEDFLAMKSGDVLAELIFSTSIRNKDIEFGVSIVLDGDLTKLQKLVEKRKDLFKLDVSDDLDINTEISLPLAVSGIYEKLLLTDKLTPELKNKILRAPSLTAGQLAAELRSISSEEIGDYAKFFREEADDIKASVYKKLEKALGSDSAALAAAKARADKLVNALTDAKNLTSLRDKAAAACEKIAEKNDTKTIADIYRNNSVFSFDSSFSADLQYWIEKFVKIPTEYKVLFGKMQVQGTVDATVRFNGVYKATVIDEDGTVHEFFLPEGIKMSVLNEYTDVEYQFKDTDVMTKEETTYIHETIYFIKFVDENGNEISSQQYKKKGEPPTVPPVPVKLGSTGAWSSYELFSEKEIIVRPVYTGINHNPSYSFNGENNSLDIEISSDTKELPGDIFPELPGYNVDEWYVDVNNNGKIDEEDFPLIYDEENNKYILPEGKEFPDVDVENGQSIGFIPKTTVIKYGVVYTVNGKKETLPFKITVEDKTIDLPVLTNVGYTLVGWYVDVNNNGEIDDLDFMLEAPSSRSKAVIIGSDTKTYTVPSGKSFPGLPEGSEITVIPKFSANTYHVSFVVDGEIIDSVSFLTGSTVLDRIPYVPTKAGYTGAWSSFTLGTENITVTAIYTPINYTASFYADGVLVGECLFTVESKSITPPAVPAKYGYDGEWKEYTLGTSNIRIDAAYSLRTLTATFMADGKIVGTVNFTVNDKSINEPKVPEKDGFEGKWETYTLTDYDITVHAIYTEKDIVIPPIVEDDDNSNIIWWILLSIVILLLIIWIISKKKEDEEEPEPPVEPVVIPEPEPEPVPVVVEEIDAVTADELMSDADAVASMETVLGGCFTGFKAIINISEINAAYADGDLVDLASLKAKKLVPAKTKRLKILADGTLDKAITVHSEQFSVQAVKMITLTGGKAVQLKKLD